MDVRRHTGRKLDQFFARALKPSSEQVQSSEDRVWSNLRSEAEDLPDSAFVSISVSIRPYRVFGKAQWAAAGIALAAALVSVLVWRHGPPFSTAFTTSNAGNSPMGKLSGQRGAEPLQLTVHEAFEVASVKLVPQSSQAFQLATVGETSQLTWIGCPGGFQFGRRVTPGRLAIDGATLLTLVIFAYGRDCTLVEGGPAWARSGEYYEIQALVPQGTPSETLEAFSKGEAPRLQGMLQTLLADRFRLVLRREMKEVPVYALTVANPEKLKLSPEETLPLPANFLPGLMAQLTPNLRRGALISAGTHFMGHAVSVSDLARNLRQFAGRIVVDKSGRSDLFDVDLSFAPNSVTPTTAAPPDQPQALPPVPGAPSQSGASLKDALFEQLGLKLEATKMPLEVLVIESVERPSEN